MSFIKNNSIRDDLSMDSDSKEEGHFKKVNLDIAQLEMLRDVLTYKAQVLRLQERTFKK